MTIPPTGRLPQLSQDIAHAQARFSREPLQRLDGHRSSPSSTDLIGSSREPFQ